jgi:hypothetical protein
VYVSHIRRGTNYLQWARVTDGLLSGTRYAHFVMRCRYLDQNIEQCRLYAVTRGYETED